MPRGKLLILIGFLGMALGGGMTFFMSSAPAVSRRPLAPEGFSPVNPQPVLTPWVEGEISIDARSRKDWVYFDFSRASVVTDVRRHSPRWDLAFQRYHVRTNSGSSNPGGRAGALKVTGKPPLEAPKDGYEIDRAHGPKSHNPAFYRWYRYSPMANGLVPRKDTYYVIRTADGGYARLTFLSYHCPVAEGGGMGCVTFRYQYRADFSRRLTR